MKRIYFYYSFSILFLGLVGFLFTHAKSALITSLVGFLVFFALAWFFESRFLIVAKVFNLIFVFAFVWRFVKALLAFIDGDPEKLIPAFILGSLALISVIVYINSNKAEKASPIRASGKSK